MTPKVSVIIPVYNKASRIEVCLKSILSQDFQDYELLIIDDGSTDGSDAICLRYVDIMSDRISYARKENGGVSSARNAGLEKASGEYICFIDADDTIKSDFLSSLIKSAGRYDIVTCSNGLDKVWHGNDIASYVDTEGRSMLGTAVWGKLYRREFIVGTGIRFDESVKFGEDTLFNLNIWARANSIKAIPTNSYCYYKDLSKRYDLSADEIRFKIKSLRSAYSVINVAFGSNISIERDINITISLYPLSKILEDNTEYSQLYHDYFPSVSYIGFLNDIRCSPVIRIVTENLFTNCREGVRYVADKYKKIYDLYGSSIYQIHCPFHKHQMIIFLISRKLYYLAASVTKIFSVMYAFKK